TTSGRVDFAQGLFQLVAVDGANGYVFTLASNAFVRITDPDFYGSARVAFLDGRWLFARPGSQQFYWTDAIDNATAFDALDFASAESAPDKLVGLLVDKRDIILAGEYTIEPWYPAPIGTQPYQRNSGAVMESGLAAAHTLQRLDNSFFWLAQDKHGQGIVMRAGGPNGYQPFRVSSHDIEARIATVTDLSGAYAMTYQLEGQAFYVLNIPGVNTTLVYDASLNRWHERAEWIDGELQPWRATGIVHAFGKVLCGGDGKVYELDRYADTFDGDVLYREITSPHNTTPGLRWQHFPRVRLSTVPGQTKSGLAPVVELRYSNDGGDTWGDWVPRSMGRIGEYDVFPTWHRTGRARDRVWQFRCTDDCRFTVNSIAIDMTEAA
ncbi:MAG: hypothetical protein ACRC1H_15705, partial [Caldilineaceae bacterium]